MGILVWFGDEGIIGTVPDILCVGILKLHLEYGFTRSVGLVVTAE
jgi:hypothetical protein